MFTGIVEELGEVVALDRGADSARLSVRGPLVCTGTRPGDSVAVDGTCLTVTDLQGDTFTADVMAATLAATTLGGLEPGASVNLERAVPADGRFGGHVVQGHVDGTGTVVERVPGERWELIRIAVPVALGRYVVDKGSLAVDGVSLTVAAVDDVDPSGPVVTISLIPETLTRTTLGRRAPGDPVNLETDVLAKYVERMLGTRVGEHQEVSA
jgi:riboflavin synthase